MASVISVISGAIQHREARVGDRCGNPNCPCNKEGIPERKEVVVINHATFCGAGCLNKHVREDVDSRTH